MAAVPPLCDFGWKAPAFSLRGTDGKMHTLDQHRGAGGTLVAFICNHCPYVLAVIDRFIRDAQELKNFGVNTIAICSNDAMSHPDDGFEPMKAFAKKHNLPFPYLHDETQSAARAYGAVCTPDFFGFNAALELQYRGRLDESKKALAPGARRELFEAMTAIAKTGHGPRQQAASMGCSIKWKAA